MDFLQVWGDDCPIAVISVKANSPDADADGDVDASDVSTFAHALGARVGDPRYTICLDLNEDGSIDAGDISFLAIHFPSTCP